MCKSYCLRILPLGKILGYFKVQCFFANFVLNQRKNPFAKSYLILKMFKKQYLISLKK